MAVNTTKVLIEFLQDCKVVHLHTSVSKY